MMGLDVAKSAQDQAYEAMADIRVFPINALPALQLVDAGIDELCHRYETKWKAVSRYYQEVRADLLFCPSDIVIQAEAMGAAALYTPDGMPSIKHTASTIRTPKASRVPRMMLNARVVRSMRNAFPSRKIAALVYGPFTVAGQVAGEQAVLRQVWQNDRALRALLKQAAEVATSYARLLMDSGADLLWISDPLAALLPPDCFDRFAGSYLRQVFQSAEGQPGFLHICGDVSEHIDAMVETGCHGISLDQCMDMLAVEDRIPEHIAMIGNLDPVDVVALAPPETVAAETSQMAGVMGLRPNYILSTGCALPPSTPLENIRQFIQSGNEAMAATSKHASQLRAIAHAVTSGDEQGAIKAINQALDHIHDPLVITQGSLMRAIQKASACYEVRQSYLPEILLSVDAFYKGMDVIKARAPWNQPTSPRVVVGTVQGDLHSIGKDLVRTMLEVNNIGVMDLGVDVSEEQFVEAVFRNKPEVVGLSVFISATNSRLDSLIMKIRKAGAPNMKVIVGGAAVNHTIAKQVGADGFAKDAVEAVKLVKQLLALKKT